jgi:hypothetical protein
VVSLWAGTQGLTNANAELSCAAQGTVAPNSGSLLAIALDTVVTLPTTTATTL